MLFIVVLLYGCKSNNNIYNNTTDAKEIRMINQKMVLVEVKGQQYKFMCNKIADGTERIRVGYNEAEKQCKELYSEMFK